MDRSAFFSFVFRSRQDFGKGGWGVKRKNVAKNATICRVKSEGGMAREEILSASLKLMDQFFTPEAHVIVFF